MNEFGSDAHHRLLNGEAFGRGIAGALKEAGVDAAIMVST